MRVYFYETQTGNCPIKRFIDKLPEIDQARFLEVLDEIERYGLEAGRVIFKPIDGKLWEIKFKAKTKGYRILYVLLKQNEMIWLHAFAKKTQKIPKAEIKTAYKRLKEVLA